MTYQTGFICNSHVNSWTDKPTDVKFLGMSLPLLVLEPLSDWQALLGDINELDTDYDL